jgi:hypothetical protein
MAYRAVRTAAVDAGEALASLWAANLPVSRATCDEKHRWFYLDAPTGEAEAFLLSTDEGPDAGRAIGCAGVGRRAFMLRGRPLRVALLADLAVDRRHRSGFPVLALQRTVRKFALAEHDVTYGFPNEHAVAVHLKLGYRELGRMERWVRVLEHGPYVKRLFDVPVITTAAGTVLDVVAGVRDRARATPKRVRHRLAWSPTVDARFDALADEVASQELIIGRRDAAFVRWRHLGRPAPRAEIVALETRGSRQLRGWAAVVRVGDRHELADFLAATPDDLSTLLQLLVPALRDRGGASVSAHFLGAHWVGDVLADHGFHRREAKRSVIVDAGPSAAAARAEIEDARRWYLTDADEDT